MWKSNNRKRQKKGKITVPSSIQVSGCSVSLTVSSDKEEETFAVKCNVKEGGLDYETLFEGTSSKYMLITMILLTYEDPFKFLRRRNLRNLG